MKYTNLFGKTNKKSKSFDSINATLLQKAGFIDQIMSGVYTYLPLGLKVLLKIENIVREEMSKISSEVLMPSLSPRELWEKTNRANTVDVIMETQGANELSINKNKAKYILNSTHEEIVTPLVQKFIHSYKNFPVSVFQIQTKFRNEPRAKSGLLRCREFRMKDLYSFHTSEEDLKTYYEIVKQAYINIFNRLGIGEDTIIALASGGDFTEDFSHEFQTICDSGEDLIFYAQKARLYFNREIAPSKVIQLEKEEQLEMKEIFGENITGVEELVEFLNIDIKKTIKTLYYEIDNGEIIGIALRGDYEVNELKVKKELKIKSLNLAKEEKIEELTGAKRGYAGIINLPSSIKMYYDDSLENTSNLETGANKTNYHVINVNFGRDIDYPSKFYDFKLAKKGDYYPNTNEEYIVYKASEVGNIFPLYKKYSKDFDYKFVNKEGKEEHVYMGCYGLGTSRVMGVIVEKFHDDKGIVWPNSISPFDIHIISLNLDDNNTNVFASDIYSLLKNEGFDVLFDDRNEISAGEKFADADLIGIPIRLVISKRNGNNIEISLRKDKKYNEIVSKEELINKIKSVTNLT